MRKTITVEIGDNQYKLELDRMTYVRMLKDKEYAEIQNELSKNQKENKEADAESTANSLIICEKTFYYSLLKHQPEITKLQASELLDIAIDECGYEEVINLISKLMESFTQGASDKPKKKLIVD